MAKNGASNSFSFSMTAIVFIDRLNYHSGALRDAECPSWDGKGFREALRGMLKAPGQREVAQGTRHGPSENGQVTGMVTLAGAYINHYIFIQRTTCALLRSCVHFH